MTNDQWQTLAVFNGEPSAQILAGLLQSEGIEVRIAANAPVPGLDLAFRVEVPAGAEQRARAILASSQCSEDELTALALSEPPPDDPA